MRHSFRLLIALAAGLAGCASGTTIQTGQSRAPVPIEQVQVYFDPPEKFETLGIVSASSDVELSKQKAQERAINELKKRAGALGANGVLLASAGKKSKGFTGYANGYGGFFASSSDEMVAEGQAIYVTK